MLPTSNRRARRYFPFIFPLLAAAACGRGEQLERLLGSQAPYERYAQSLRSAGLDATALGRAWIGAGESALQSAPGIELPFREAAYFGAAEPAAQAWSFEARRGVRLTIALEMQNDGAATTPPLVFAELFLLPAVTDTIGVPARVKSAEPGTAAMTYEVQRDGRYALRIQPELLRSVRVTVTLREGPTLAFPVAGRDGRAIRSFWGASRDAGRRRHQGIDIFAPRRTPAIAATDGRVTWVGTNRLGGKVIFVWDEARGHNLYYAHLDSQVVQSGRRVRIGDTIGLIGNTGNARGTAPHLHFGIYRRGYGAVDPFPFVRVPPDRPVRVTADTGALGARRRVATATALRATPASGAPAVMPLGRGTALEVLGATGAWFRARLPDGSTGYIIARSTERAVAPLRRVRRAVAVLRDRPAADAVVVDSVAGSVTVLGRFGQWDLVRDEQGREGWIGGR
jgi:murein DD-endopeptidase MepM/ murein hydrolase activator NlpD